jgi:hypothetical protein
MLTDEQDRPDDYRIQEEDDDTADVDSGLEALVSCSRRPDNVNLLD